MSKSRRRRKSKSSSFTVKKKRSALRTVLETVMGVSFGAGILFLAILWFRQDEPEKNSKPEVTQGVVQGNVIVRAENYELIRDSGNLENQLNLLMDLNQWPKDAETPVRLDTLGKRLELAQTILEHEELTEEGRVAAAKASISAIGQIYGISIDEEIDTKGRIKEDYLRITSQFSVDSDPEVAKEAVLAELKILIYDNSGKLPEKQDEIRKDMLDLVDKYPNDQIVLATLRLLVERVKFEESELATSLYNSLIERYKTKPEVDEKILLHLKAIEDRIALGESDIGVLTPEIAGSDQFEQYFEKLIPLIERQDTGIDFLNKIYSVVGFLEAVHENEKAIRVLEKIKEHAPKRQDVASRYYADRMARFGIIRNSNVGKPFDFTDMDAEGLPVDLALLKNRPVILAFYSPNNAMSENLLNQLNQAYSLISNTGVKVVSISVEEAANGRADIGFHPEWIKILNIPPKNSQDSDEGLSKIFMRCPVSHVPYFAIVDSSGVLRELNVPTSQMKTRLEAMVAQSKSTITASTSELDDTAN